MQFKKLDINKHDLNEVSRFIYETELDLFKYLFGKNQEKAQNNLKRLIYKGNNSFGHDKIHIVTEDNEDLLGILISYSGDEINDIDNLKAFFSSMGIIDFMKLALVGPVLNKLLTTDQKNDDYYLSNVYVDKNYRGKGTGTFILEKSLELAREKNAKRVTLDVDIENKGALRLYERFGFKIYNKKSINWFGKEIGTFNMEYFA
ncbi:MAG: GNAT family N-acetyltransferase [Methanobacterium sp.]